MLVVLLVTMNGHWPLEDGELVCSRVDSERDLMSGHDRTQEANTQFVVDATEVMAQEWTLRLEDDLSMMSDLLLEEQREDG